MRLEIIIPDDTRPEIKAKLEKLTHQLSEDPELASEIMLDDDIHAMFTPGRIAHIDHALDSVNSGEFFTAEQVRKHFAEKKSA